MIVRSINTVLVDAWVAHRDEAYEAFCRLEFGTPAHALEVSEYDTALEHICELHGGEDKTPAYFDRDTFEVYHNVYKSDMGFRPRGDISIAGMKKWLENSGSLVDWS